MGQVFSLTITTPHFYPLIIFTFSKAGTGEHTWMLRVPHPSGGPKYAGHTGISGSGGEGRIAAPAPATLLLIGGTERTGYFPLIKGGASGERVFSTPLANWFLRYSGTESFKRDEERIFLFLPSLVILLFAGFRGASADRRWINTDCNHQEQPSVRLTGIRIGWRLAHPT
ncbi:hypothetical protein NDU88_004729 [Pleurodeles waltl]|uniref:Uncharacterized protein n=1 Tax=Pleurodeles waltl TaxID=8319 RepID=A0AAV7TST5_PLEWA|nr:hypothetical protein NDU88_004729 [Pleurodeles waltl]